MSDIDDADDLSSLQPGTKDARKNPCDAFAVALLRYVDHDLVGQELQDFQSHLESCTSCQETLEKEKALSQLLHRNRPLYSAPAELRARVSAAAAPDSSTPGAARRLHQPFWSALGDLSGMGRVRGLRVLAPALVVIALCLAFVPSITRDVRAANYVESAVTEHRSYLDGSLPAGFHSDSAERVTNWFAGKVPFDFRLPTAQLGPDTKPAYRLTGASVVHYKGSPAALVTYETQNEKISLLAVSDSSAVIAGGEEVRFGRLTFHYYAHSGFRVITWSNHGLAYALVSSVSGSPRASCMVCHQNMTDKGNFNSHP
jgi:anti-sigma factor RsiW